MNSKSVLLPTIMIFGAEMDDTTTVFRVQYRQTFPDHTGSWYDVKDYHDDQLVEFDDIEDARAFVADQDKYVPSNTEYRVMQVVTTLTEVSTSR